MDNDNVILAGDFNSNSIWDRPNRIYNHTNLVDYLNTKNILSAYHHFQPKFKIRKKTIRFLCTGKLTDLIILTIVLHLQTFEVGNYETWTTHSDHKPLTVTIDL